MKHFVFSLVTGLFVLSGTMAFAGPQDFTLTNNSGSNICYVYISASDTNDWEEDVLGADDCLSPGDSIDVSFNAGSQAIWDLRVEDENGNYEDYQGFNLNQISEITVLGGGEASYR